MIKLVAVAFLVAIVSAAQAMPRAVIQQPDSLVTTVREACGAGMHRVNGVCVRTAARRTSHPNQNFIESRSTRKPRG
jgi:hypothetical protein